MFSAGQTIITNNDKFKLFRFEIGKKVWFKKKKNRGRTCILKVWSLSCLAFRMWMNCRVWLISFHSVPFIVKSVAHLEFVKLFNKLVFRVVNIVVLCT